MRARLSLKYDFVHAVQSFSTLSRRSLQSQGEGSNTWPSRERADIGCRGGASEVGQQTYQCQLPTFFTSGRCSTIQRGSPSPHYFTTIETRKEPRRFVKGSVRRKLVGVRDPLDATCSTTPPTRRGRRSLANTKGEPASCLEPECCGGPG
jgi:hypothetical protein